MLTGLQNSQKIDIALDLIEDMTKLIQLMEEINGSDGLVEMDGTY